MCVGKQTCICLGQSQFTMYCVFSKIFNEIHRMLENFLTQIHSPHPTSNLHAEVFQYFSSVFCYNRNLFRFSCVFSIIFAHCSFLQHSHTFRYLRFPLTNVSQLILSRGRCSLRFVGGEPLFKFLFWVIKLYEIALYFKLCC